MPARAISLGIRFAPLLARTQTFHTPIAPIAFDFMKFIFVRAGSARLVTELGTRQVNLGDVVFLSAHTLCGAEPEDWITTTTIYMDRDYVIDQMFWQYAAQFRDRLDASEFFGAHHAEPAEIVRIGEERTRLLTPWLDELAALSVDGIRPERFLRAQSLLFSILDLIVSCIAITEQRTSTPQSFTALPSAPRHRQFRPLRAEAQQGAEMIRGNPSRRWSVQELADAVHLSQSQFRRVFVNGFGKAPIAYLTMVRTQRMADLLRTTNTPIAVISQDVGWADPDFAALQFRRSVGVTPSQYRAMSRARSPRASG
jgi:AraC family transcriptional regulator